MISSRSKLCKVERILVESMDFPSSELGSRTLVAVTTGLGLAGGAIGVSGILASSITSSIYIVSIESPSSMDISTPDSRM